MSLAARLANLSPEKRQLLMQRLQSAKPSEQALQRQIQPQQPRPDAIPLSFNQQRLWFLDKLQPGSASYNTPIAIEITGDLNITTVRDSLMAIARRHEVLRTYFVESADGTPAQAIASETDIPFEVINLATNPDSDQSAAIANLTAEFTQRPFQLDCQPPIRAAVLELGSKQYILLVIVHHILADGWSMGVLLQEFHHVYTAISSGASIQLPELPIQYADYSIWQRQWLQGERFAEHLEYWKQQMAGERPALQLPTDRPRPAVQSFAGAKYKLGLPDELHQALKALSKSQNCTLFVTLLAAFKTLLYRYTGQEDITIGTAMVNRDRPQLKSAIGFFANTVLLRSQLDDGASFSTLLQQVSQTTIAGLSHQELPFDVLVKTLQPDRDLSRNPLFQVWFALHQTPMQQSFDLAGLELHPISVSHSTSRVDLSLDMAEIDGHLTCVFEYSTDLFDEATIAALASYFQILLTEISTKPAQRLSQLKLLPDSDIADILRLSQAPALGVNQEMCLHQWVEQQAQQTPAAIAVQDGTQSLTYRELNERADRLAIQLRHFGVGHEDFVGLCTDRSIHMPIGMLAILKAGAAYVPIDLAYPAERIALMLKDSGAPVIVTLNHLQSDLPEHEARVLLLDGENNPPGPADSFNAEFLSTTPEKVHLPAVHPQQLAYQIYTSGSTGKPKGVQISHAAVVNFIAAMGRSPGLESSDVLLSVTTVSFDIAVLELFLPLTTGATVAIASREVAADATQLSELIETSGATVMQATPVTWQMLLDSGWAGKANLKVLCGGEALPWPLARALSQSCGELWNLYGPTEATVWTAAKQITSADTSVTLGQAIANTQLYVLDRQAQLVPTNVPGELHVGGEGLARGYFKRSALTAERFCPDPFSQQPGARLYKTGDLVRYRRDGSLEFLGRIDNQVKLRGFRIELGEIESCLLNAPDAKAAVVVVRDDSAGQKRLVAYAIPGDAEPQNLDASNKSKLWRQHLQAKLPAYMMPHAFVVLETFPLTPNGKVDRKALPAPGENSDSAIAYGPPQTPAQQILSDIWAEVLNQERIGIHDNFFELGGDSIVAMQAVAKAKQAGLHLTPKQLFQNQTIETLAAVATFTLNSSAQQEPAVGPVSLTPLQHEFLSHYRLQSSERGAQSEARGATGNHHVRWATIELPARCQLSLLQSAFEHLHAHHDGLRLQFTSTETGWEAEISPPQSLPLLSTVALSAIDLAAREAVRQQEMVQAIHRLNLEQSSLVQAVFFDNNQNSSQLFVCGHPMAIDEMSWDLLLTDLATIYRHLEQGQDIDLPAKTSSIKTWGKQLQDNARSSRLLTELNDYWSSIGSVGIVNLPTDFSESTSEQVSKPEPIAKTERVTIRLEAEKTGILLDALPSLYNADICDGILAALVETVGHSGASVLINVDGDARGAFNPKVDVSRTIGNFTSSFPLLLHDSQRKSPGEALKTVKEAVRAVPNDGIGFGVLRYLNSDRDVQSILQALPQAELSLTYLQPLSTKKLSKTGWQLNSNSIPNLQNTVDLGTSHTSPEKLAIVAQLQDNCLCFDWYYSPQLHRQDTITQLAQQLVQSLQNLATHCQSPNAGGYTPSDFPLATVEPAELTKLFGQSRAIADLYPLSPVQEGMLFHTLYSPEAGLYFDQMSCKLTGALNIDGFKQGWAQVIQRYDVLRTAFLWQELDRPLQAVHHTVPLPWTELDWQQLDATEQGTRLNAFLRAERERGFDLAQPPLMRLTLIHMGPNTYYFVWSRHHLLLDGWSLPLVMQAVLQSYEALCNASQPTSLPVAPPYRDYIGWLQNQNLEDAKSFWRKYLLGWQQPLAIAALEQQSLDVVTKPSPGSDYAECTISFNAEDSRQLETCVRQQRLTLNTLIQGLWSIVLAHCSGQQDLVFGATIAGRPTDLPDVEAMVGLFINTLPVRVQVDANANLLNWLQQLQATQLELNRYAYSPLADIQAWGDVPRGQRLFETIVVFENYPVDAAFEQQVANLSLQGLGNEIDNGYPLTLRAVPKQELALQLIYDSCRLTPATVRQLANHLKALLDRVLDGSSSDSSGPDNAGSNMTELSVGELTQLLQISSQQRFKQASRQKLGQVRRKVIRHSISVPLGGQDS